MLIKKVVMKILSFGKLFRTYLVSMAIRSRNQLKFLNVVTMATTKIVSKLIVMLINFEGTNTNIGFWKII